MGIYNQGYRAYEGTRNTSQRRIWVIARDTLSMAWKRRMTKILLVLSLIAVASSSMLIYGGWQAFKLIGGAQRSTSNWIPDQPSQEPDRNAETQALTNPNEDELNAEYERERRRGRFGMFSAMEEDPMQGFLFVYQKTLLNQGGLVFLLAMAFLCGIVARDRRAGAIPIYLTRGISPRQYFFGKLLAAVLLCAFFFVLPMFLLGMLDLGFAVEGYTLVVLSRVARALLIGIIWSLLIAGTTISISTFTARPRLAAFYCAVAAFAPMVAVEILGNIFIHEKSSFSILSPLQIAIEGGDKILGVASESLINNAPLTWKQPTMLVIWTLLLLYLGDRRVKKLGSIRE